MEANGTIPTGFYHDHEAEATSDFKWGLLFAFILWPASFALGISLLFRQRISQGLTLIVLPVLVIGVVVAMGAFASLL